MDTSRTLPRSFLFLVLLALAFGARAEILIQYAYTDPYGVEKTATATTPAINPQGDLRLALVGGLDRHVRVAFVDTQDNVLTMDTSARLGAEDRIVVNDLPFSGAWLALPPPAGDGIYLLRAEVLDESQQVLETERIPVQIDRTPPIMTGAFGWDAWRPAKLYPLPENTLLGAYEARRFWADGLEDATSGLNSDGALYQSVYLAGPNAGQIAYQTPAVINAKAVSVGNGSDWDLKKGVHFPAQDGAYSFRFIVFDRAGNAATFGIPVVLDAVMESEALELFAVFDPDSTANPIPGSPYSGYSLYLPGMTVKTNPVKMLARVARAHWWQDNPTGITFARKAPPLASGEFPRTQPDYVDADYVYLEMEFPYPGTESLSPDFRVAALTAWGAGTEIRPELVLAPGANATPRHTGIELRWASGQTIAVNHGDEFKHNTPDTLTGIRVTVEPRAYDQVFSVTEGYGGAALASCQIPAGGTGCLANAAWSLAANGDGMLLGLVQFHLRSLDGSLYAVTNWVVQAYDGRPPVVESLEFATVASARRAVVTLTEYMTGEWWALVQIKKVWLEATGGPGSFRLPASALASTDGVLWWRADIPLTSLPSGVYNLAIYAEDNFGNRSEPLRKTGYVHDATSPVVKIRGKDGAALAGTVIGGLAEINFVITDSVDPQPVVEFVRLVGGPDNENVAVGFHADHGIYRIEYPAMQPSATANDYRIEVSATDASGNHVLQVAPFTFQPGPLRLIASNGDTIALPLTEGGEAVRLPNNHWPLTTEPVVLHTVGGQPLRGAYDLVVRLSADAVSALKVDSQTLAPGGELRLEGYDFTAMDSVLALPLAWAGAVAEITPGYAGQLSIEILRDGAPVFTADLEAWEVNTEVAYRQSSPTYAAKIEEANLAVVPNDPGYCAGVVVTHDPTQGYYDSRGQEGDSVCAVRWSTVPAGLAPVDGQQARQRGYLNVAGTSTPVAYQPGLLIKRQGRYSFFPTGGQSQHAIFLTAADPPEISFTPAGEQAAQAEWRGAGEWPAGLGRSNAGTVSARGVGPYQEIRLVVTDVATGAVVIDQVSSSTSAHAPIFTELDSPDDSVTLHVRAFYARAPEMATQATYRFVTHPEQAQIRLRAPDVLLNTLPLIMRGQFGVYHQRQIEYSAASMGEWAVRLYREFSTGPGEMTRQQVGSETTQIAADGSFTLNLGLMAVGGYRLVATATYLGTGGDAPNTVESNSLDVRVNDGTPVAVTITAQRPAARLPCANLIRAVLSDPARALDVERVTWERSRNGSTWETIECNARQANCFELNETLTTSGAYWYRATTHNRHTAATYTAAPFQVQAYQRPTVLITGALRALIDHPVTWTAAVIPAERPVVHEWTVRRETRADPAPLTQTTAAVTLPANQDGNWYVTLRSRFADAPDVPGAWSTVMRMLKVSPPALSRPKIIGEAQVEIGRPYTYTAQVYALGGGQGSENLTVASEWLLPDGSVTTGTSVAYIPTSAEEQVLRYRAWVVGYREATETTTALRLQPWAYTFPSAQFYKTVHREFDPAVVTYTLRQTGARTGAEVPGVQWTFPPGATVERQSDTRVTLKLPTAGTYTLAARVFDTRGNEVRLEDTLNIPEPDPLVASAAIQIGDIWARAPANVTLRWYADGLLSKERVTGVRLTVNGDVVSESVKSDYTFRVEQPGSYDLRFDLTTSYDRTVRHSDRFELITGTPPACALTPAGDGVTSLELRASCTAPMGKVVGYQWLASYADAPHTLKNLGQTSAHTVRFTAEELARRLVAVTLTAINDKGQMSNAARWTPGERRAPAAAGQKGRDAPVIRPPLP